MLLISANATNIGTNTTSINTHNHTGKNIFPTLCDAINLEASARCRVTDGVSTTDVLPASMQVASGGNILVLAVNNISHLTGQAQMTDNEFRTVSGVNSCIMNANNIITSDGVNLAFVSPGLIGWFGAETRITPTDFILDGNSVKADINFLNTRYTELANLSNTLSTQVTTIKNQLNDLYAQVLALGGTGGSSSVSISPLSWF